MTKVLVTGGTGYIGSHTVVELIDAGYTPVVLDNLSNSHSGILEQIEKITGQSPEFHNIDLCDRPSLQKFFEDHQDIKDVIHFAALKSVGESVEHPLAYYENNVVGLLNLLNIFRDREVNFVFSSSCTVYGQPDNVPVDEETPLKAATSPYGQTKKIAEDILRDTAHANQNYNIISCRYFNPVGAQESALIGELPIGNPQNLIPMVTQVAVGKRDMLTVYGQDYQTEDGTAVRDYIHVVDLAKAHIAALKRLEAGQQGRNFDVFNLGAGKGYSVLQIVNCFESISGVPLKYEIGPRREGDIARIYADSSKAHKVLNWKTELDLEDALKSAWAWELYIKDHDI